MYSLTMNDLSTVLEIIWNIFLLVPRTLLALFPLYNTLTSFRQDLIAAALGASPIVIWLFSKVFAIIRYYLEI